MDDIEHAAGWIAAQDERIAELEAEVERLERLRRFEKETHRWYESQVYENLGHPRTHGWDLRARASQVRSERDRLREDVRALAGLLSECLGHTQKESHELRDRIRAALAVRAVMEEKSDGA